MWKYSLDNQISVTLIFLCMILKVTRFHHSLIINLWNSNIFENPTSVITSILMLLVVLSLSGSRSVCWSSSTWRGTEGDGGIGGMPTHFATDDDDGKHGARLGPPGSAHFVGDYVRTYLLRKSTGGGRDLLQYFLLLTFVSSRS